MKKRLAALLTALFLLPTFALAQEYYTLPEIREQAKDGWHETYTDKYGREIQVDIDVDVFGGETAPVLRVSHADYKVKPEAIDDGAQWRNEYDWYISKNNPYDTVTDVRRNGGRRTHLYRTFGEKIDLDKSYGHAYGNDLTVREMYKFALDMLKKHDLEISNDFAFEQPQMFDVLCNVNQTTFEAVTPAFYHVNLWAELRKMPVLQHVMYSFKNQGWPLYMPQASLMMRNQDEYRFILDTVKETEMLAEDIPLCSLEQVIEKTESWIESGKIQKVYSLQFGYALYNEPGHPKYRKDIQYASMADYYAVPSWVLTCAFMEKPEKTFTYDYGAEHEKDPDTCEHYADAVRELVINAQTGELMNPEDISKNGTGDADYKGFIPWNKAK